ncbi:hypothetical protein DAEQUDRAFT_425949 [Daedalea quercina L-15889]|uniref:Cation/H+ exchanger transmembrane domain-containing protein n=1 Tax=Daedalea quercina L-15889 TaxID=1314783 RepID=A0A165NHG9_9APHY|nr:hypothetical protein DAEQUDRAFT_425949 [Daedalea quercina L-15889]
MDIASLASLSSTPTSSFPYTQPGLPTLLTALSFLFFLNFLRMIADVTLHAGLVAELFLGMVYGAPLAGILPAEWETAFNVLGYLGLVFVIFEGGLSTNLALLLRNLPLSCFCALTGIRTPMALSFALLTSGYGYPPLEAFAAGAALSSTSLGTTLAALNSVSKHATLPTADSEVKKRGEEIIEMTGDRGPVSVTNETGSAAHSPRCSAYATISALPVLQQTRIGTVLTSAAIIDDVVGLVIAALIPGLANMESSSSSNSELDLAWTLIRPLLSSLLIALITPVSARFILRPAFWFREVGERWCAPRREDKRWGCSLSGTKWGTESHADFVKVSIMVCVLSGFISVAYYTGSSVLFGAYMAGLTLSYLARPPHAQDEQLVGQEDRAAMLSFESAYARTLGPLQEFIFAPIFFASIGYAIPFLLLWRPTILWRGVLYALLMCIGKLAVGLPVVVWSISTKDTISHVEERTTLHSQSSSAPGPRLTPFRDRLHASLYPAAFVGIAMISRGEIGLLIAQIARNGLSMGGTYGDADGLLSEEGFLVCIWAILLCTLVGPICTGVIVRKWRHHVTVGVWG